MASNPITLGDSQSYTSGSFLAYIAPFNKGSYVYGKDYTENVTLKTGSLTSNVVQSWSWPNVPASSGVYDFNAIDYGYYANTVVQAPIPSTTVNNLQTLSETHNLSFSGNLQGFDAIDDLFLTKSPEDSNTMAAEVEVFLHTPKYSADYINYSTPVGTFQDSSGRAWTVALDHGGSAGLDLLFMPSNQADVASGSVDLKAMLQWLAGKGVISASWYFNGMALGTETQQGSGSMNINSWSVTYPTTSTVSGTPAGASSPPPPAPAPPPTGSTPTPPTSTTSIALRVSEDAYQGDAQFIVKVDGTQVGSTMTASALHASGDSNVFVLNGNWAPGSHQVAVQFTNDAWGGTAATDRNLYVNSIAYNGNTESGTAATMLSAGTNTFTVGSTVATVSGPADTVTVHLSEDAYNGNAQFKLLVDGKAVTTAQDVVASHAAGNWQDLSFSGNFGAGSHTIGVQFTNDAWGGTTATDRNLYVNGIDVNGTHCGSGVTTLLSNGTTNFMITTTS